MTVVSRQWSVVRKDIGAKPIRQSILFWLLATVLLTTAPPAEAQQPKKVPRIGLLIATTHSAQLTRIEAFRQGLRELGYIEGQNITIEYRYAEGKLDRLPALAAELVGLKVDVIVSAGPAATGPAKKATATIPIVMAFGTDPVGNGLLLAWRDLAETLRDCQPITQR
jgi:putative ABC transport system substrate-binding protein